MTAPSAAYVAHPREQHEVVAGLINSGSRGAIARGMARSYGDAAQNSGGSVIDTRQLSEFIAIDVELGRVTVQAGVTIDELIRRMLPFGWFVPVTPGTRYVSVGGAIAADIHGKNHHVAGSFGQHVRSMVLALPAGDVIEVSPDSDPALFWATVGGMGLTGTVLAATIALKRVPSSRVSVDTCRAANIDDLMDVLASSDHRYTYSVAWIDTLASGASMGRAVVTRGDFATVEQLSERQRDDPFAYKAEVRLSAPPWMPGSALNRCTVAAFNEFWYRKAPRLREGEVQTIPAFFHPLDGVRRWNVIYGSGGFVQYQYVVPYGAEDVVRRSLERISSAGVPSFLAVLKRFGPGNAAPLSFPAEGWTLALDIAATVPRLAALLDSLDDLVVEAGGAIYLAKDSRLRPELLRQMYPRLAEWQAVRERVDPHRVLNSDLARRLSL